MYVRGRDFIKRFPTCSVVLPERLHLVSSRLMFVLFVLIFGCCKKWQDVKKRYPYRAAAYIHPIPYHTSLSHFMQAASSAGRSWPLPGPFSLHVYRLHLRRTAGKKKRERKGKWEGAWGMGTTSTRVVEPSENAPDPWPVIFLPFRLLQIARVVLQRAAVCGVFLCRDVFVQQMANGQMWQLNHQSSLKPSSILPVRSTKSPLLSSALLYSPLLSSPSLLLPSPSLSPYA